MVDIVYIARKYAFTWPEIISNASEKDMWVNPVEVARILDEFPLHKLNEIRWVDEKPDEPGFEKQLNAVIRDVLMGGPNSLLNTAIRKDE